LVSTCRIDNSPNQQDQQVYYGDEEHPVGNWQCEDIWIMFLPLLFDVNFLIEGVVYDRIIGHMLAQACHFIVFEIEFSDAMLTPPKTIVGTRVNTLDGIMQVLIAEL
jgi:hypothetical protein